MQWDREKPASRRKQQEELLREYLTHHVYPYSPFYRRRFEEAKLVPKNVTGTADLDKLPPTAWSEVTAEPGAFILRPTERAIARFGERRLVMAVTKAKLRGKVAQLNRDLIDPAFKPVHWHLAGDVPMGYSREDLERLAEAGSRMLQVAGLHRDDVLIGLYPPGPNLPYWQLVDGARRMGVSAIHFGPAPPLDRLESSSPTVLAGTPEVLESVLGALRTARRRLPDLRTLLVLGALVHEDTRAALVSSARSLGAAEVHVVAAWAPPGVRALWAQCKAGSAFHTYPDMELVEVLEGGEVAWSSLAWHGTVFLRLRTGVRATLDEDQCSVCGRIGPRLTVTAVQPSAGGAPVTDTPTPAFAPDKMERAAGEPARPAAEEIVAPAPEREPAREPVTVGPDMVASLSVLDEHPGVGVWQAELRRVNGEDELIVFVAPAGVDRLGPLFRELDTTLQATQYVVLRPEQVQERRLRDGAVLDLRRS